MALKKGPKLQSVDFLPDDELNALVNRMFDNSAAALRSARPWEGVWQCGKSAGEGADSPAEAEPRGLRRRGSAGRSTWSAPRFRRQALSQPERVPESAPLQNGWLANRRASDDDSPHKLGSVYGSHFHSTEVLESAQAAGATLKASR